MDSLDRIIDSNIVLVDVGARNRITDLRELRRYIAAYGFEPSSVEYKKLITNSTDLELLDPNSRVQYKSEKYFPYAIGGTSGQTTLFITKGAGSSSTLRPNTDLVSRFKRWGWGENLSIVAEEQVEAKTLLEFLIEEHIDNVDYLKLDTQGNEYDILASSGLLDRISIIKTEVEFIPLYQSQKLHHDISSLLYSHGFIQIDLKFEATHYRYLNVEPIPGGVLTWADAYYMKVDVKDPRRLCKQALTLLGMGYEDISLDIVRRSKLFSDRDFFEVRKELVKARLSNLSWKRRSKMFLETVFGIAISRR